VELFIIIVVILLFYMLLRIINCSILQSTSGSYSIYLSSGYQRFENTNSSMNNAYQVSGILIYSPSSFTSLLLLLIK